MQVMKTAQDTIVVFEVLTDELLEKGSTSGIGWNRKQMACLGVDWPLQHGWKKAIIGRAYPAEVLNKFLLLAKHAPPQTPSLPFPQD